MRLKDVKAVDEILGLQYNDVLKVTRKQQNPNLATADQTDSIPHNNDLEGEEASSFQNTNTVELSLCFVYTGCSTTNQRYKTLKTALK